MSEDQKLPIGSVPRQVSIKPDEKHVSGIDFRAAYAVLIKAYVRRYVANNNSAKKPKTKGGYKP
ncbi:MAG: hypothetical protein ACYDBJ_09565 [Aggregatilineales bacterium]